MHRHLPDARSCLPCLAKPAARYGTGAALTAVTGRCIGTAGPSSVERHECAGQPAGPGSSQVTLQACEATGADSCRRRGSAQLSACLQQMHCRLSTLALAGPIFIYLKHATEHSSSSNKKLRDCGGRCGALAVASVRGSSARAAARWTAQVASSWGTWHGWAFAVHPPASCCSSLPSIARTACRRCSVPCNALLPPATRLGMWGS